MDKCESCVARVTQMLSNAKTYDVCALYQYPCDMMTKCDYYIVKADVQPVKRGKWLNNKYEYIAEIDGNLIHAYCSNCKRIAFTIDSINRKIDYELCPHCGADMRNE